MTKARKAPQKKVNRNQNRGLKIATAMFVLLSALVALSMVLSGVFTQNPKISAPPTFAVPTITRAP